MTSIEIKLESKDLESNSQICRLCLSEESLESVFKEENLPQWISEFLSIVITAEDRLSQATCAICRIRLTEFHQYKMRCHEVQEVLQSMAQQDDALTVEKADHQISSDLSDDSDTIPLSKLREPKPKIFKRQLTDHRKIHRPNHKCTQCSKSFATRQRWEEHVKRHSKDTQEDEDQDEFLIVVKERNPDRLFERPDQEVESESRNATGQTKSSDVEDSELRIIDVKNPQGNETKSYQSSSNEKHLTNQDNDERYACSKCKRTFNRECQLKNHMKIHDAEAEKVQLSDMDDDDDDDNENITEEDESDYNESSPANDNDKGEDATDGKQQLQCNKCDKVFHSLDKKKLSDHKRQIHGPKNHRCPICERPFSRRWSMKKHLKTHQGTRRKLPRRKKEDGIDTPFKCAVCTKSFMTKDYLKNHVKYAHGPKTHECHICGYRFSIRYSLDTHIKRHTRYRDSKEDFKSFKQAYPKEASTKLDGDISGKEANLGPEEDSNQNSATSSHVEKKPLGTTSECGKCNKMFPNQKTLWYHYKFAHGTRQKCSMCNVAFLSTVRFTRHMLTKHQKANDSDTTLKCEKCSKVCSSQKTFRAHMKTHGPRCHRCKLCPKAFTVPFLLKLHMKSHEHAGDGLVIPARLRKGFECTICHKVICHRNRMQAHIREEHGSQLHECSICRKLFVKREDMELHVKNHSAPDQMEVQGSVILREDVKPLKDLETVEISPAKNATNDSEVTTEESKATSTTGQSPSPESEPARKFECGVCHKQFLTRFYLNEHIRKVHEAKTHVCSLCGKGFISNHYLKRHQSAQRSCSRYSTWSRTCEHMKRNSRHNEKDSLELLKTDHENHFVTSTLKNPNSDMQSDQSSDNGKSQVTSKTQSPKNSERQNVKKRRSKGTLHSCLQCISQFTSKVQLKEHMKSTHQQENASSRATQLETDQAQAIDRTDDQPVVNAVLLFEAEEFKIEPE